MSISATLLSLLVVVVGLSALNHAPSVHEEVLLQFKGPVWVTEGETIEDVYWTINVPSSNEIVKCFCSNNAIGKDRRSIVDSAQFIIPLDEKDEDDTEAEIKIPTAHWFFGAIAEKFCGVTNCVPENSLNQAARAEANLTAFLRYVQKSIYEIQEDSVIKQLIHDGTIPLVLQADESLSNMVLDRSIKGGQAISPAVAMSFASVRPIHCIGHLPSSILLDIELIDFRSAVHGSIFKILHMGGFNSNKTAFNRLDLPRHIIVDRKEGYTFVDIDLCRKSKRGLFVCENSRSVIDSPCNLATLAGCSERVLSYRGNGTSVFNLVTQFGDAYVVASTNKVIKIFIGNEIHHVSLPASGVLNISVPQGGTMMVGDRAYAGLNIVFDYHHKETKFEWSDEDSNASGDDTLKNFIAQIAPENDFHPYSQQSAFIHYYWILCKATFDSRFWHYVICANVDMLIAILLLIPLIKAWKWFMRVVGCRSPCQWFGRSDA